MTSAVEALEPGARRKRANTRRRLIDAAHDVFVERGIRDTPVEAICERAGFTRGAFYSNFATKEELFLELFREQTEAKLAKTEAVLDRTLARHPITDDASLRDAIAQVLSIVLREYVVDAQWYMVVAEFRWQGLRQPELSGDVRTVLADAHRRLGESITARLDAMGIRVAITADELGQVLAALYEMLLERALFDGASPSSDDRYLSVIVPSMLATFTRRTRPRIRNEA